MIILLKRNLKNHFRTPASVIFSIVAVLIAFFVCAVFLENSMIDNVLQSAPKMDRESCRWLIECWIMAGLVSMTPVTASCGAFAIMIVDSERKIIKDFKSSPLKKYDYPLAMVLCAAIAGFLISLVIMALYAVYIYIIAGVGFTVDQLLKTAGMALLTSVTGCCVHGFLLTYIKTLGGFSNYSTFLGTNIGFFNAIYLPMGSLPAFLRDVVKIVPYGHAAPIMRDILMAKPLEKVFGGAPDTTALMDFRKFFGVDFYLFDKTKISYSASIIYMIVFAIICFILFMARYNAKREQF
ncbi:MAG: ABC transporter permease [Blautia sp.]|nr:ABC transporter permease [Blautia sp.]